MTGAGGLPAFVGEIPPQGFLVAKGAVLSCSSAPREGRSLRLLLKGQGLVRVLAPGIEKSRRRGLGSLEPLVFARFRLYRSSRSLYLREVEPFEAFLPLRGSAPVLRTALGWCAEIISRLPPSFPCDELLGLLYWSLCLLARGIDPAAADFRLAWRWLRLFGVAPDLLRCGRCGAPLAEGGWGGEGLLCPRCLSAEGMSPPSVLGRSLLRDIRGIAMLSRERFAEWGADRTFAPELSAQGRRLRFYFEGTP